ncbi:MAG: DUF1972 domain-containing protein [Acidobacteriota bacterium]
MKKLKIAILGTRGIPNNYGGFEECAARLSVNLVKQGHAVTVYNPDTHPFEGDEWEGVKIKKIFFKENIFRFLGVFIFDYLSLKDAVKNGNDIILELGYSPASLFYNLNKRGKAKIVTNMDGLEWKREKWNFLTRKLLKYFEKRAVKKSDALVSDNIGIKDYLVSEYNADSCFIPYGADLSAVFDESVLTSSGLKKGEYFLSIARLEPENNIETILDGYKESNSNYPFVVIGPLKTGYAGFLVKKYKNEMNIKFMDGIYDQNTLINLRHFCRLYFHGHSVGGTNPSLLEAMSVGTPIAAHENIFNRSVLGGSAYFFSSSDDVKKNISDHDADVFTRFSESNIEKITKVYNWVKISDEYLKIFYKTINKGK